MNLTKREAKKIVKKINNYTNNWIDLIKSGETSEDAVKRVVGLDVSHYSHIYGIRDFLVERFNLNEEEDVET